VPKRKPRAKAKGPTLGQVTEKVSSLRSRIAVTDTLIVYLETHFQGVDGQDPEERLFRDDYAQVPPGHINEYISALRESNDILESELNEWELIPVTPPSVAKLGDGDA